MCTAINKNTSSSHFFGRNLDFNFNYDESIVIVPNNYPIKFKHLPTMNYHYPIMGIGIIQDDYPFFFDCINDQGLAFAGLNFPNNAKFFDVDESKINVAPYELPLYFLSQFKTVKQVKEQLKKINIANTPFSNKLPLATLHYIIADKNECIVIEQTKDGLFVYDNPYGVLTNNPPFTYHIANLSNYMNITNKEVINRFAPNLELDIYGKALGAIGLPGDSSPTSRFVKATFLLNNIRFNNNDDFNVNQMLHILNNVSTLKGETLLSDNSEEVTIYSSMYNLDQKQLFIRTYENNQISKFSLDSIDFSKNKLIQISIPRKENYYIIQAD